ncbi:MAG TPA: TIGR03086 family metal-binding protein [Actinospica sp.]|jgi:uncharacterized protein (TIGR03086 family)|nr:TIGR03086 family metal-binding protein [Actinospica sp.]
MDFRPYDRSILALNQQIADQVGEQHLGLPTPCAPWTVGELLSHMVSQHLRFAAVARGEDPEQACPLDKADLGTDPAAAVREAADALAEAFAAAQDETVVLLPEIGRPLPLGALISFHFFDFVVHGWDLAVSINARYAPPAELSALAAEVGKVIPDSSRVPGGSFAPRVEVGSEADELARLLGLAGRDPAWSATSATS